MKILLQRVTSASVHVDDNIVGSIGAGYLLFIGVLYGDTAAHAQLLAEKITKLRLFDSQSGTVNDRSVIDVNGEILVVSQFTLAGNVQKGNRPDYTAAADADTAKNLYEYFIAQLQLQGVSTVESGEFGANMQVELVNDGPVTLIVEQ